MNLRIAFKTLIKKFWLIPSYCKDCGVDIKDFVASDELWQEVMGSSNQTVCYNCFCKRSGQNYRISEL